MRRIMMFAGAAVGLSVLAAGCFGNSSHENTGGAGEGASGPAWTLTLNSACLSANEDQCIARYGFSLSSDGKFQVGPGPKGQIRAGKLSESELTEVNAKLQNALATARFDGSRPMGHEGEIENEGDGSITYTHQGKDDVLIRNTGADFYFATDKLAEALSVHNSIRDLAKGYYRLPFGNDCADAAEQVHSLYTNYQGCQVDNDCVYVDAQRSYEVIPPSSTQWLFTDDCRAVLPLTVANKSQILGGANALQEAFTTAESSCGNQFYRETCSYEQKETSTPPVCVQNRCQARF